MTATMPRALMLLLLLLVACCLAQQGACEPFAGVPAQCLPVLGTAVVYVPAGSNQSAMAASLTALTSTPYLPAQLATCQYACISHLIAFTHSWLGKRSRSFFA
jgi:hypothetical protein